MCPIARYVDRAEYWYLPPRPGWHEVFHAIDTKSYPRCLRPLAARICRCCATVQCRDSCMGTEASIARARCSMESHTVCRCAHVASRYRDGHRHVHFFVRGHAPTQVDATGLALDRREELQAWRLQ